MKKIYKDKITNIPNTELFDNTFLFDYVVWSQNENQDVEMIYMSELLESWKNEEILAMASKKPAMYSNVYSPVDELEIFEALFHDAIANNKRIHIVGITLDAEVKMLEAYYEELGFLREDINCFAPDFSVPLVTASVKIENLIWKGSDYKRMGKKIFFTPPVRESGENKAMFKGINRGVIAGIYMENFGETEIDFLSMCVREEKILALTLGKLLKYNTQEVGLTGKIKELKISY